MAVGSGIDTPSDVATLQVAGITVVLNLREADERKLLPPGLIYLHNPTADDGAPKDAAWFKKSINFALKYLLLPDEKIYVHCAAGIQRSPSTCYAILRAFGLGKLEARATVLFHRPVAAVGMRYAHDADRAIAALGYE